MFEKLEAVEKRYEELTKIISDPEVIANQTEWQKAMKEHASMEEIVLKFREYKKIKQSMEEAEELMQDPDMKELAEEEYYASKEKLPKLEEELKVLLIPKRKRSCRRFCTRGSNGYRSWRRTIRRKINCKTNIRNNVFNIIF